MSTEQLNKHGKATRVFWNVEYYSNQCKQWMICDTFKNKMSAIHACKRLKERHVAYRVLCYKTFITLELSSNQKEMKNAM